MSVDLEIPQTMQVEEDHNEPEQHQQQQQPSQRELTMRAIAERAEERRQEEIAQGVIYDEQAREAGLTHESHEQQQHEETHVASEPEPEPIIEAPAQPAMRSVTFEGRTFDVTDEQYAQLAQMGMLANVALHQYAQPPAQQQPAQQQYAPQQPPQIVDPDLVRETVRKIQYGGEEDGGEALTKLITDVATRAQQPAVDTHAIARQAAEYAQVQAQLRMDSETIQKEYKPVFDNPQRTLLAKLNVDAIRARNLATGRTQSDMDVYREAGNAVLEALNLPRPDSDVTPAALQAAPVVRQDVIERKRAAPRPITQVDRRAPAPQTPRPPSGSDIVERMRQARGQSSMM